MLRAERDACASQIDHGAHGVGGVKAVRIRVARRALVLRSSARFGV
jgi:hypothetical protein